MITITTPGLLFPALSLLMLAFTNRFLALAALVRSLNSKYEEKPNQKTKVQIIQLSKRLKLIRNMQALGIFSLLLCTICIFFIFVQLELVAVISFVASLVAMALALLISLQEIIISVNAIKVELSDIVLKNDENLK
jgi:hypothetical protein